MEQMAPAIYIKDRRLNPRLFRPLRFAKIHDHESGFAGCVVSTTGNVK